MLRWALSERRDIWKISRAYGVGLGSWGDGEGSVGGGEIFEIMTKFVLNLSPLPRC